MTTATISNPTDVQTIGLREWGADLTGRTLAQEVRATVRADADEVIFDCEGIESMSPSFADELFGKLAASESRPPGMRIVNANAGGAILAVIRFAVQQRTS